MFLLVDGSSVTSQQEHLKMDRISKLPIGIIETILCFLPIKDAARTSILSKEWRYHWIKIPKLAFIEDIFQPFSDGSESSVLERMFNKPNKRKKMDKMCKLFYAIYQVLLTHEGPIHEFTLSMHIDDSCVEIDRIILHLLKKNTVKILKLDFNGTYKLPLSFFSLHHLTDLYLNNCRVDRLPTSFVFGSLTTLYLQEIRTCGKTLLRLLSSCPLLKRLTILSDCGTIDVSRDSTIADFFKCLPVIEYMSIWFFIFACFLPIPKEVPTTLIHLKYLCIECVWFSTEDTLPFLVLLIKSSPNLEKLKLEILDEDSRDGYKSHPFTMEDYPDIILEHLNELEILHFMNEKNELDLVRFLLANSPLLKKVRIFVWDEFDKDEKLEILDILLSFPCASTMVKIIVS